MALYVVTDVPRPWFLASLPSSVGFICLVHMNHSPQLWTTVLKCGSKSTIVDPSRQMWIKVYKCRQQFSIVEFSPHGPLFSKCWACTVRIIKFSFHWHCCYGSMITIVVIHFLFEDICIWVDTRWQVVLPLVVLLQLRI